MELEQEAVMSRQAAAQRLAKLFPRGSDPSVRQAPIIARTADAEDVEITESGAGSPATPSTWSTEKPMVAGTCSTSNK
jgi:hypothetical protein